eukprot:CAMPEP_0202457860 /NCGR_PEP_ID=MMETSP1360-20130828/15969_1 /ASSEMBLY_ACC=CAM_ASM_000848 /TAXON_ID=515479 /ORGANISM="Licmophora paradoxa, Strain CCMP2313" /LENGTH=74 /DNA_ID=CAMNT_0049078047 /DNA_START=63 /DNA_END=283 /DNA_ORIENTATION=+
MSKSSSLISSVESGGDSVGLDSSEGDSPSMSDSIDLVSSSSSSASSSSSSLSSSLSASALSPSAALASSSEESP